MKIKTIRAKLKTKFKDFLKSIDDPEVKKLVQGNTIITGGAIASMLLGENVNDYDLYFRNRETAKRVAEYYVNKYREMHSTGGIKVVDQKWWKGEKISDECYEIMSDDERAEVENRVCIFIKSDGVAGEEPHEFTDDVVSAADEIRAEVVDNQKPAYKPVFLSANAITLSNQVQLIIRFYGEVDEIHTNYDYVHCTNSWTSWDNNLHLRPAALECLLTKELRYVGSKYPLCSIIRIRKFIARGWTINAGQIVKMCLQVSELNLHSVDVLEDQLIGVDTTYFAMLIAGLRNKQESGDEIDNEYVMTIIDKIF